FTCTTNDFSLTGAKSVDRKSRCETLGMPTQLLVAIALMIDLRMPFPRPAILFLLCTTLVLVCSVITFAQIGGPKANGEAVYKQRCAGCHEQTNPRIPSRSTLNRMPATRILSTLDFGVMMTVAYPMTRDEREAVASYLGSDARSVAFPNSAYCK